MNTNRNKIIPLAEGEALALFALTLYSQAFLLLLGCILCMVSYGISTRVLLNKNDNSHQS